MSEELLAALAAMNGRLEAVERRQMETMRKVDRLSNQASRWRGGLVVLIALGGLVSTLGINWLLGWLR